MNDKVLLQVEQVKKIYPIQKGFFSRVRGWAKAVDGVDIEIYEGETFALVGESGCGKTTVARLIMGLTPPTEGSIKFCGQGIYDKGRTRVALAREMQMIFQDVYASLNPRKTVREILSQPLLMHHMCPHREIEAHISELLESVELSPPALYLDRFPHEFSGGQKQRIAIARAIGLHPRLIVADEPVSGLDMSVRAGILELMKRFRRELNQSYLFITHDLAVVRSTCDRVAVMYLGKIVEQGTTKAIFERPLHPYTRALLDATPIPNPRLARQRQRVLLTGEVPSCVNVPAGCRFHPRCPQAVDICRTEEPVMVEFDPSHRSACHLIAVMSPGGFAVQPA